MVKLATFVSENPNALLKLTASSVALTTIVAKLIEYQEEKKRNLDFFKHMSEAYADPAQENYAEIFNDVSIEADALLEQQNKLGPNTQ